MALAKALSQYWLRIQSSLFPWLEEELGEMTEKEQKLVTTLELIRIERFTALSRSLRGRPPKERAAVARAFVAKAVYNMPTTRSLLDRLACDKKLRRICGWEQRGEVPSESTFSRAFTEFSESQLPACVHQTMIIEHLSEDIVSHISRDATEIEVREKPPKETGVKTTSDVQKPKRKLGRPRKGEELIKEPTRLERQRVMTLEEMLEDLPKKCDVGTKMNSKGLKESWIGFKLHLDAADGQIPVSCILTSASTHDSQVALPLATMTSQRVINLYDLMDSAYDAPIIREHSGSLGHVPIIDINPRRNTRLKEELRAEARRFELLHFERPEDRRYKERTNVERVYARLKDEFGGRVIRVRGYAKVMTHLMFGILALTADQLMRLVTQPLT
ncbi:MAG: transposase [Deltaproteobacteria bacterium]|nr:transposase [Deltaproteobacteria bacterium]